MYDFIKELFLIKNDNNEHHQLVMRGGIPLYPRSTRQRKRKKRTLTFRLLQSGLAVSVLILYTSNQIGSTYAGFNSSQRLEGSIGLCTVFPNQIEQKLLEFNTHIQKATELRAELGSLPAIPEFGSNLEIEGLTLDELDSTAQQISAQISSANSETSALEHQLHMNAEVWQKILNEINSAAALLDQVKGYMIDLEPNCLEIRNALFFQEWQSRLIHSNVLSDSLTDTLSDIFKYLTTIHEVGSSIPSRDPEEIALQLQISNLPSREHLISLLANKPSDSNISVNLLTSYEQLNTGLTNSKTILLAQLEALQNQQLQLAEVKSRLLEQAAKEEAERLEQEKKEQNEKKDKDADHKENKPKKDEAPVETAEPPKSKPNGDSKHAEASEQPVVTPSSTPEDTPEVESIQPKPHADTAADPSSALPASPTDSDSDKGGDS